MFRTCLLAAATALCAAACGVSERPQNVLVVLLDTTRADHLSCYGYERATTPVIDRLAAEGARFEDMRSQSSLTPVSASTLLTGSLPYRHGVRSLFSVGGETLSKDVACVAELWQRSGRRTAAFVSAKPMGAQYGLARGFETYHDDLAPSFERHGIERASDAPQRPADDTTELALAWLEQHGREPFALLVHYFDAHDPSFVPPRDWLERNVSFPLPENLRRAGPEQRIPALTVPRHRVDLYDAELRFMDEQLGRIVERLRAQGTLDETLIVVLADHGEAFGEHGFWTHGILYEEQLHVPFVLRGPGIEPGTVVRERGRVVDVLPTLAELLDLPAPSQALDGRSLAAYLRGGASSEPRDVYAEVHHAPGDRLARDREMYALRSLDWKYIHRPATGRHELYDLASDPNELVNLYSPAHPRAVGLALRLTRMGALGGAGVSLDGLSEAQLEELRALGYL
ncbi:MAG: DUF229 domain-containing protein [Planctomycetes bacterium]|nr:DUF229 domain-containing protein [Planctomycetota bacterium]